MNKNSEKVAIQAQSRVARMTVVRFPRRLVMRSDVPRSAVTTCKGFLGSLPCVAHELIPVRGQYGLPAGRLNFYYQCSITLIRPCSGAPYFVDAAGVKAATSKIMNKKIPYWMGTIGVKTTKTSRLKSAKTGP